MLGSAVSVQIAKSDFLSASTQLTQEQFAAKVGVTFSTVNRWEKGKSKPSPLAMRQIEELMERT
ncbi:MAG: hypothetical protein C4B58_11435 [Deltaproteobacteria bacterium]|nr:MAG: hypothetical protein C4B58_11435 [Deltaproteobacteria bacterium]